MGSNKAAIISGLNTALEITFGHRNDSRNVFRYNGIRLNLPGHHDYKPTRPWVYKERKDKSIASDALVYVTISSHV